MGHNRVRTYKARKYTHVHNTQYTYTRIKYIDRLDQMVGCGKSDRTVKGLTRLKFAIMITPGVFIRIRGFCTDTLLRRGIRHNCELSC